MAINAYDVQLCLWKMLKISSKTCFTISTKHPYVSSSLLFLFILYICVPLLFWILIYSLPLLVCTCIILSTFFYQNGTKYKENEEGEKSENHMKKSKFTSNGGSKEDKNKKLYNRVHSVRRRRAKEIMIEEVVHRNVEEEKNAVSSTNFNYDMIDKNALIEESPKEIREVEVDITPSDSLKHENNDEEVPRLGILIEDEGGDDEKNVMEMGISDAERNKRLESLIARRRSRQMVSLQVRRSLMNMDKNEHSGGQIASLILPKINTMYSPSKNPGQFSPGPGSAPSVLIPMRNPFDLPYDPHEEKPDLTSDSFNQEYTSGNNRENMVYCRHESFNLGPSLTVDRFFQNQSETSSVRDFGFRQRSSTRFQFFKPGNETDKEFSPITEQTYEVFESKSNINNPDTDQIKEIIQVHENNNHNHSELEGDNNGEEWKQIPQSDFNSSSSSPSSSSSEEDEPVFKIDREAILKSLSSMRRNALIEIENNERIGENNLTYANSALENASKLKRHGLSYTIASDMNVEVSEVSSPPLTIDENMANQDDHDASTYDGEEADENRSDVHDMTSIRDSREQPLTEKHCVQSSSTTVESDTTMEHSGEIGGISAAVENYVDVGRNQVVEVSTAVENNIYVGRDQVIEDEQINEDLNDDQEQSFSPDIGVRNVQSSTISPKSVLLPTLSLLSFDPYIDHEEVHQSEGQIGEASSPVELQNPTVVVDSLRDPTHFDGDGEAVHISEISSTQDMEESSEPTKSPTYEQEEVATNSRSEVVRVREETEDTLILSEPPAEVLPEDEESPDSYEGHTESSRFHQGISGQTTSTSSSYETPIDENSEYCKSNEDDRKIQHYPEPQVDVMPETIEALNKVADQE